MSGLSAPHKSACGHRFGGQSDRARGWPIVGDPTYGPPAYPLHASDEATAAARAFARQALHAWRLRFPHPITGDPIALEAELPADMRALLEALGIDAVPHN